MYAERNKNRLSPRLFGNEENLAVTSDYCKLKYPKHSCLPPSSQLAAAVAGSIQNGKDAPRK